MPNKIYITAPAGAAAGGVEALYQLADILRQIGKESYILFDSYHPNPIVEKYKQYNLHIATQVEDSKDNWIIYPEVWTDRINEYKNLKKAIWWLSVDNNHSKFNDWSNNNIIHLYQSYYAFSYLLNKGASYYLPLFDYINDKYFTHSNFKPKSNIVCYNPAKGQDITNIIINSNPDIKFIPLVNMTEDQVIDTLSLSKIYIDFGHHPGKDRIPREAAVLNNCVITSFKGSSMFYNDVPIDIKYKFENINKVGEVIKECFNDFEYNLEKFSTYRSIIKHQKEEFINQVKQIFKK